jgi:phosphatidylserine/phosphatidylglycerophosphate/cardiolipin synthase-like enzyme
VENRKEWRILFLFFLILLFGCAPAEIEQPAIIPVLNQSYLPCARELIQGAEEYIHILLLEIHKDGTTISLMEDLISAKKRGVETKVLLENNLFCNQESLAYLKGKGIEVKLDSPGKFLHHKLMIIDGKEILIGSTNWSYMSLDYNNETNVLVKDSDVAHYYESYFQLLWEDPTQEPKVSLLKTKKVIPLAVKKDYFNELHNLLNKAGKRIHIIMYGMRYYPHYQDSIVNTIFNDLIEAKKRGVKVKVLLEKSGYNQKLNSFNKEAARYLEENGIEVRFDSPEVHTHAKLVIVDDTTLLGSSNWGYGGLELYLGSNVILLDPQITDSYEKYFQRLWLQGGK